jgi:hypothetical protein
VEDENKKELDEKKHEPLGVLGWLVVILVLPVVIVAVIAWHFGPLLLWLWPHSLDTVRAEHPILYWVGAGVVIVIGLLAALARLSGPDKGK